MRSRHARSAAVGCFECLNRLRPKLYRNLATLGTRLAAGLADAARAAGVPVQVNAFGSLLTPFFTSQPVTDYASATRTDTAAYAKFFRGMLARGIYPPPSQFEAWFLSAAHTTRDVDRTIAAARELALMGTARRRTRRRDSPSSRSASPTDSARRRHR